jgi:hypothetical protein
MKHVKKFEVNFTDRTQNNEPLLGEYLYSKFFEDIDNEGIDEIEDYHGYSSYLVEFYFLGEPPLDGRFFESLFKLKNYVNTYNIPDEDIYIKEGSLGVTLIVEISDKKSLKKLKKEAKLYHSSKKYNL